MRKPREMDKSSVNKVQRNMDRINKPPPRIEVRMESKVMGEILVTSGGPLKEDNINSQKFGLKRARHKVMIEALRPNEEKAHTLSFSLSNKYDAMKPHPGPFAIIALVSSLRICKDMLKPANTSLVGLAQHKVKSLGTTHLTLTLGKETKCVRMDMNWTVVDYKTT